MVTACSVIGLSQVFDFVGILSAGPAFKAMQSGGLGAGAMFTAVALLCLAAFLVSLRFAAHFTVRFVVWVLAHTLYRVKARGLEHLPARAPGGRGGALLVANHVSFVDAVLLAAVAIDVLAAALVAHFLGPFALDRARRDRLHKVLGYTWVLAMAITALSSFFIHSFPVIGPFSPIHLLALFALWSL